MIDFSSEFGQRAHKRLSEEEILWLTTIDKQGIPQPRPVWFLWDGETFLVFSQSQAHKVAHIQNRNQVALNLNSTFTGGDVVVLVPHRPRGPAGLFASRTSSGVRCR